MAKIWPKNVLASHKKIFNWSRGLEDMSQKADFERGRTVAHSCTMLRIVKKSSGNLTTGLWVQIPARDFEFFFLLF